jgi:hypothetical protein
MSRRDRRLPGRRDQIKNAQESVSYAEKRIAGVRERLAARTAVALARQEQIARERDGLLRPNP